MKLLFLGTGAADWLKISDEEYAHEGRRTCAAILDGHILLDVAPKSFEQALRFGADPAAITDLFVILGTLLFAHAFPLYLTDELVSTITALLIGVVGFFMVYRTAKPFNRLKVVMFIGILLLFVLAVSIMPAFFHLFPLDFGSVLVLVVFVLMIPSVMNLLTVTLDGIRGYYGKAKRVIAEMKKTDESKQPKR